MRERIKRAVEEAGARCAAEGSIPAGASAQGQQISVPKQAAHGDFSTNCAMMMASRLKTSPRELAGHIAKALADHPLYLPQ